LDSLLTPTPPLAIIGIGCLFPGSSDFAGFWASIVNRVDAIRDVPPTHWSAEDYLHPDPKTPDRVYSARGGFLDPVPFNPTAFGIPPSNLEATDSSQLLGLIVAQQALADCGYTITGSDRPACGTRTIDRSRISVILGVTGTLELVIPLGARLGHPIWRRALQEAGVEASVAEDVVQRIADAYVPWQENSFPGLLGNVVAGRIANRFDLGGTNCVVDAACASSLSAIHLASMELATGRADVVLTGGVDTFNDIFMFTCFSKTPALSPTGNARPFDSAADGTVLGEGLGMIVLKRLDDARRDGDTIYAVLRGVGSSSDGRGNAIYAPRKEGQVEALRNAYRIAGVSPDTIELVEAHGTGTKVGDATEVSALAEVYRNSERTRPWCALGSIKSQLGHTKAAAGVAGLLKAAAALHHKVLPPTIKVTRPQEILDGDSPFYVNAQKRPWLSSPDHPRRAAVSAFGFGGSNFHCVLEEAGPDKTTIDWTGEVQILAFHGDDASDLKRQLAAWPAGLEWADLRLHAERSRRQWRPDSPCRLLVLVKRDETDLAKLLTDLPPLLEKSAGKPFTRLADGVFFGTGPAKGKLAVLFPGQGAQYPGMLLDLACHFPAAQQTLTNADRAFTRRHGRHLVDLLYPPSPFTPEASKAQEAALRSTDVAQPALGAVSLGAWRVLETFGVRADALAGHSYGELTALCAAGRLDEEAFHSLSLLRGQLMARSDVSAGGMLAVKASESVITGALREEGIDLVLANKNAPEQTVLSGPSADIDRAAAAFAQRKVSAVKLSVATAFHSPIVASAREPLLAALAQTPMLAGHAPVYANTNAAPYPADPDAARELLAGHLARPVEWVRQVEAMYAAGARSFLEVGPGARLSGLVEAILSGRDAAVLPLDASSGKRGFFDLAAVLAWLAARGHAVNLTAWDPVNTRPVADAPGLPGQGKRAHTVTLTGANFVKPRPPAMRKPVAPIPVQASDEYSNGSNGIPNKKMSQPEPQQPSAPVPPPAPVHESPRPSDRGHAVEQALQITRENLVALQKMQEQTAHLHRQFLDSQEQAHRTVHLLVEQQQRLVQVSLGLPVSPLPAAIPPAPMPAPIVAPPVVTAPAVIPAPVLVPVAVSQGANGPNSPVVIPSVAHTAPLTPAAPARGTLVASSPATNGSAEVEHVQGVLLEVIAEKTGYPADMLELGMTLDADLGIDSIKRVEILSALQEKLPRAPAVKPEHLGTLHTLGDIATFLAQGQAQPEAAPTRTFISGSPGTPGGAGVEHVQRVLLEVIAQKTGYPADMLELGMTLDADLGIDSIKRVEILSAIQECLPGAPTVKPEHLGTLHTLGDIANFLANTASSHEPEARARETKSSLAPPKNGPAAPAPRTSSLERSIVRVVPLPPASSSANTLPGGAEVWIAGGEPRLAKLLQDRLTARGMHARLAPCAELARTPPPTTLAALVILSPAGTLADDWLRDTLLATKQTGLALRKTGGLLVTVSRMDGAFGLAGPAPTREPLDGGLAGLVKTAAHEWPEVRARAIDLDERIDAEQAADMVENEMFAAGPIEVGISASGRLTLDREVKALAFSDGLVPFQPGDVVVVSGGARGVTAEVAIALARHFRPTLVLLGRSPLPEAEPDWLAALADEQAVKRELSRRNSGASPRAIGEEAKTILAGREVRTNLERIRVAGSNVVYRTVNIRDAVAVADVLREVRQRFGTVRGLVHGAGVLADARIEDKTGEQFDAVYGTKVNGLRSLLSATADDDLSALVLFSSSTARFGRAGQVDYAIANEVLNKLAWQEAARRPGCRVMSINWGPWDGGMVTPALRDLFAREGIGVIPLEAGAELLAAELRLEPPGPREVVVLAAGSTSPSVPSPPARPALPQALPVAFERVLNLDDFPVLEAHVLNGRPVVPTVLLLEWLAHAALVQNPGYAFHGCDDLRVLQGVTLDVSHPPTLRVGAGKAIRRDGFFVAPAEVRSLSADGREVLHARAEIVLANSLPAAPASREAPMLPAYPHTASEIYHRGLVFHGPAMQCIEHVDGCGEPGIAGTISTAPSPSEWMRQPLRQHWLSDPLVIDGSFQLVILWSLDQRGAASLPCHVRCYRQYRRSFTAGEVRAVVNIERASDLHALASIDYIDSSGKLVARIDGYECVIDPALERAFKRNLVAV
jgi:acyl transferase domain-containing protein/NAD(P)-dependent dehydrogenase (short-subunit alcohol dehydrogenase family)/acyl carrier protein